MGYTTDFSGEFNFDKRLTPEHANYLKRFAETRRMERDEFKVSALPDVVRKDAGLPVGPQGCYFVGGEGYMGQDQDPSIVNFNDPPIGQPGLWCQWVPSDDGDCLQWDGGEKFYDYVEWLEYLIKHFIAPWGYKLNGEVRWEGESSDDLGKIVVKDNSIDVKVGTVTYG